MSLLSIFNQVEISHYIYLSTVLFSIGLFGVLFRRNAIILLMCIDSKFQQKKISSPLRCIWLIFQKCLQAQ